jgi:hypothetical protein
VNKINQANDPSSQLNRIVFLRNKIEIFRDKEGRGYLGFQKNGNPDIYPIGSQESNRQISYMLFMEFNKPLDDKSLKEINRLFEGIAFNEGEVREVFIRHGFQDGVYYLDLGNENCQQVKINENGFTVIDHSPIAFRRTPSMQSFPSPVGMGNISLMWRYLNVPPEYQILIMAFILESFRPDTQYVMVEIIGQKGTGKSATVKHISNLIDPNIHDLIAAPKDAEDVFVHAHNNAFLCYDNLSGLTSKVQDAFCSASTGGSAATRKHFTNFDEASVRILRPAVISGKQKLVTRDDLADRTISIELSTMEARIPAKRLKKEFENDWREIFTGILDLFSKTLKNIPKIEEDPTVRMGDFQILGEAMTMAMGKKKGEFTKVYKLIQRERTEDLIEDSPVAIAILNYFDEKDDQPIKVTCKDLREELSHFKESYDEWPATPKAFAAKLRDIAPALNDIGIIVKFYKKGNRGIPVSIKKLPIECVDLNKKIFSLKADQEAA